MLQFTLYFFFVLYDQLVVDVSFLAIKMSKNIGATEKANPAAFTFGFHALG